jgi:predicted nucleic acid-binding protein
MIAVDSNLLVYAVREDSPWHQAALACLRRLAEGPGPLLHR